MPHAPYVPLRIFSSYTMLEGALEPKDIVKHAKRHGFPAAALTDRNGLYAAMPFSEAAMKEGVQPIIGAMLGVARPPRGDVPGAVDWLALYAQDEAGYREDAGQDERQVHHQVQRRADEGDVEERELEALRGTQVAYGVIARAVGHGSPAPLHDHLCDEQLSDEHP